MDEAARAEMHPVLLLALAPEGDADVADAHRLRDLRAPALLELRAEGGLAAAGLARDEHALDARRAQVESAVRGRVDEVRGVGRREHGCLRPEELDRPQQPLRVPRADGDMREPDPVEARERRPGHERPGVVRRDDPLARADT